MTSMTLKDISRLTVSLDDPELYDGAYVGIQLIGRKFQEEKILVLAEYLGNLISSHRPQDVNNQQPANLKAALA